MEPPFGDRFAPANVAPMPSIRGGVRSDAVRYVFPFTTEYLEIDYTPLSLKGRKKVEDPAI